MLIASDLGGEGSDGGVQGRGRAPMGGGGPREGRAPIGGGPRGGDSDGGSYKGERAPRGGGGLRGGGSEEGGCPEGGGLRGGGMLHTHAPPTRVTCCLVPCDILSSPFPEVTDDACLPWPLSVLPASTDPPHYPLMPTASGTKSRGAAFLSWPAVYVDTEGRRHAGIVSQVGGVRSGDGRRFNSIEAARVIWLEGPSVWFDRRVGTPPTLICLPLLGSLGSSPVAALVARACCPPLPYFASRPSLLLHTVCHPEPGA